MRPLLIPAAALILAACQPANDADPGEMPADPPPPASSDDLTPPPTEPGETPPATTTPAFVGRWSADLAWCANSNGDQRPVELTATEFRGYENTCQISDLVAEPDDDDAADEWTATFTCSAEGQTTTQPVRLEADEDELEIAWVNERSTVEWRRCPT